ncbi:MAG: hypothetical protein KJ044_07510, partial [Planctomycetes bacterium]|nr:hypothetical protein [Planctomycetota bacterium]
IVAYFMVFRDKTPPPAPAQNPPAAQNPPSAQQPPAGTPGPGTPGAAGPAVASNEPLPMPKAEEIPSVTYTWPVAPGVGGFNWDFKDFTKEQPYDPLRVQDLYVVAPERRQYIDKIRQDWVLEGISITPQHVLKVNERGEPELSPEGKRQYEKKDVREAWFKGKRRPYKAGERLTGTRFVVTEVVQTRDKTSVKLRGDNGEELELELAIPSRYPD